MTSYRVSFFKDVLSSDGHPFKCLQHVLEIRDARNVHRAAQAAERSRVDAARGLFGGGNPRQEGRLLPQAQEQGACIIGMGTSALITKYPR